MLYYSGLCTQGTGKQVPAYSLDMVIQWLNQSLSEERPETEVSELGKGVPETAS